MPANEIEIVVKGRQEGLDKVEREAKQAGNKIGDSLGKGMDKAAKDAQQAGRKVTRELEQVGDAARDSGQKAGTGFGTSLMEGITESVGSGQVDAGGLMDGMVGDLGKVAAVGTLIGTTLIAGFQRQAAEMKIGATIAAQNGGTAAQAQRLGDIAGDAFNDGFGASLEEMGEAVNAVISQGLSDMDAPEEFIGDLSRMAQTAAEVTGAAANDVARAASVMMKTGLAANANEAFDLIVSGSQRGANAAGDLLDVLTTSSVNLRQFGLSGEQAVGVLVQAMEAGAPSADTFTGALEELIGNASDGIPVFEQLGLGGQQFAMDLAGGGPKAAAALDQLLDSIRNIQDPAERSRVMVQLFGEEATAMQSALLAVDPSSAADKMDDFAGKTEEAAEVAQESRSLWDDLGRGIGELADVTGEALGSMFGSGERSELATMAHDLADFYERVEGASGKAGDAGREYANSLREQEGAGSTFYETLEMIISAQEELAGGVLSLSEAEMGWQEAIDKAEESLKENGKTLDITTEKGRSNRSALNDLAESSLQVASAMEKQGADTRQVQARMTTARAEFIRSAVAMGMSKQQANALADQLRLIPGNYRANTSVSTGTALAKARELERALSVAARDRYATVHVAAVGSALALGNFFKGGKAHGGIVGGDTIGQAASGGVRSATTMINEAGPEIVELPTGSRVMTAGSARAAMEAGMFGGGGGAVQVGFDFSNASNTALGQLFQQGIRQGWIRLNVNGAPVKAG